MFLFSAHPAMTFFVRQHVLLQVGSGQKLAHFLNWADLLLILKLWMNII
jgi:hypothetical protein